MYIIKQFLYIKGGRVTVHIRVFDCLAGRLSAA